MDNFYIIFCQIGLILTYFLTNMNNFDLCFDKYEYYDLIFDKYDLLLTDMTNFDLFLSNTN